VIDWLFRSRRTGKITVAQFPNVPLGLFLVAIVFRAVADPTGTFHTIVDGVAAVALAWWAVDEIGRGVNPFRRMLGGAGLVVLVRSLVR